MPLIHANWMLHVLIFSWIGAKIWIVYLIKFSFNDFLLMVSTWRIWLFNPCFNIDSLNLPSLWILCYWFYWTIHNASDSHYKEKKKGDTWNAMPSILTSKHKNAIPRAKGGLYSHHPFLWCLLCSQYWKPWKMVQCLNNLWKQRNLFSSYFEGIGSSNFVVVDLEAGLLSFTLFFQWKDFVLLSV